MEISDTLSPEQEVIQQMRKNWNDRHKKRATIRARVNYLIKRGKLTRSTTCQKCGQAAFTEAHHPDYDKPLDVEWLCHPCHRETFINHNDGPSVWRKHGWTRELQEKIDQQRRMHHE